MKAEELDLAILVDELDLVRFVLLHLVGERYSLKAVRTLKKTKQLWVCVVVVVVVVVVAAAAVVVVVVVVVVVT